MLKEILGLDGRTFNRVAPALFAYLFHRINQRQFINLVGDKELSRSVLNKVRFNGYVLKNCKLYAWAYFKHRSGAPKPSAKAFRVHPVDAAFLRRLNLNHLKSKYEAYDIHTMDTLCMDILHSSHMQTHIGKLISKKMLFLTRSYGETREDLENDLRGAALRAIYRQYPRFETLLHMTNTAKTTIHNTAMSTISYHTCPARQKLYTDHEGQHQAVHDSLDNVINAVEAPRSYMSHVRDHLETIVRLAPRMRPEVQQFLLVCCGHPDEQFSSYLGKDNTEAVDHMDYPRYLDKAREFFGFSEKRMTNIFARLRAHLT